MITRQNIGGKVNRLLSRGSPWAVASIQLDHPHVIVVTIDTNGKPSVGLRFEQDGIIVEVELPRAAWVRDELTEAIEWELSQL